MKAVVAALLANIGIAISEVRRVPVHGLVVDAVGGDPLRRRLGQPGAPARRQQAVEEGRPTTHHNFGYGRRRYVYGFIVAIVLFLVGGLFSLYEGWHKWQHPEPLNDWWIAVVVLLIAIGLESFSFRTAIREANHSRGTRSMAKFVRDARQPELPVILLEDAGALVGLVFALLGVGLAVITGDGRFDAMGAMAVGTLLVVIAIFLAMEMAAMLVGESALPEETEAIRAALESSDGVLRVIHLRTLHVGPDELLVAAKIAIAHGDTGAEIAEDIDDAEAAVRAAVPDRPVRLPRARPRPDAVE